MELLISAAEPSGDRLAAELVGALREHGPVTASGIAGPAMRAAGVRAVAPMEDVAVMGLVEVLGKLGPIRRARAAMRHAIQGSGARALVVIDAPDLHLPLAQAARDEGIPAIGYVSPQVWAWRADRIPHIAQGLDALLCLFAFEPPLYAQAAARAGCDVRFVGHPVRDRVSPAPVEHPPRIALLPGSRAQELRRHVPIFVDVAQRLRATHPDWRFTLIAPEHARLPALPPWIAVEHGIAAAAGCRAALTKSGTVTLELACLGVPMVVAHRVHPLTYAVGKRVVTGVSHIALPNVLGGREVVPEVVQALDPADLARRVEALPAHQPVDLSALGPPGASARAAGALLDVLSEPS